MLPVDKILLKFTSLSNLLVLQKVVYLIRQLTEENDSPLFLLCLAYGFPLAKLIINLLAHPNWGYSEFIKYKQSRLKIRLVSVFKSPLIF